jgi:hypothetical protein
MWEPSFTEKLFSADKREREARIVEAHKRLAAANYTWVGFHGASVASAKRTRSRAGLLRGGNLLLGEGLRR